jgi:Peptidase C13 family
LLSHCARRLKKALPLLLAVAASSSAQIDPQSVEGARKGFSWEAGRSPQWQLDQARRLNAAIASLKPERKGVVDAFVVVIGLDSDDVFTREASETSRVLTRRYNATGHSLLLTTGSKTNPQGSPGQLAAALGAVAEKMNRKEDVLVLYTTSHGGPGIGLVYRDGRRGYGTIAPEWLAQLLLDAGIERRVVLVSACYSGAFVSALASPDSAIITASDDDRTSFGCAPGNDWTFFGDALINAELRKPQPLEKATAEAFKAIDQWEFSKALTSSKPRSFFGEKAKLWLAELERQVPQSASAKVGRPAIEDAPTQPAQGR